MPPRYTNGSNKLDDPPRWTVLRIVSSYIAVEANIRGLFSDTSGATGKVYNVAFGQRRTVNQLFSTLKDLSNSQIDAIHRDPRPGDVRHSLADISLANKFLGYQPQYDIDRGLDITFKWFKKRFG